MRKLIIIGNGFDLMQDMERIFTDPIQFVQKVKSWVSCEPMSQLVKLSD